jgi:hypothetical protein
MTLAQLNINIGKSILPPVAQPDKGIIKADHPESNDQYYSNYNEDWHKLKFKFR